MNGCDSYKLETAFRFLREQWFNKYLRQWPAEREWEDEEKHLLRVKYNDSLKQKYDRQTNDIIRGIDRVIAPRCANDLDG